MTDLQTFDLCDECLELYRGLKFDSKCEYSHCIIPFNSITWPDEHPEDGGWMDDSGEGQHTQCQRSILQMLNAREALWSGQEVPAELQRLWDGARQTLPHWPGFHRLSIGEEEHEANRACEDELTDLFDSCEPGTLSLEETEEGLSFRIAAAKPATNPKRWWRFWR